MEQLTNAFVSIYGGALSYIFGMSNPDPEYQVSGTSPRAAILNLLQQNGLECNKENHLSSDQVDQINQMFPLHVNEEVHASLADLTSVMDRSFMWYQDKGKDYYLFYVAFKKVNDQANDYKYTVITVTEQLYFDTPFLCVSNTIPPFKGSQTVTVPFTGEEHLITRFFIDFIKGNHLTSPKYEVYFPKAMGPGVMTKRSG